MFIFIIWFVLCIVLAVAGDKRKIGAGWAFVISLLLSPLIGLIVVLASDKKEIPAVQKPINKKAIELKELATNSYKEGDYQAALENLKEAIKIDPGIGSDHFNLACIYSNLKDAEQGFKHLQKAVEIGYKNFELINKTKGLQFLRNQKEFEDFAINGYKF